MSSSLLSKRIEEFLPIEPLRYYPLLNVFDGELVVVSHIPVPPFTEFLRLTCAGFAIFVAHSL